MTTYYVDNTKDANGVFSTPTKSTDTDVTIGGGSAKHVDNFSEGAGLAVGDVVQLGSGSTWYTHVVAVLGGGANTEFWTVEDIAISGAGHTCHAFKAADGKPDGVGEAWPCLQMAMDTVINGDIVYVKWSENGYVLDGGYSDQNPTILEPANSGSIVFNWPIIYEGYYETVGDMRPGGDYFQNLQDVLRNGIDSTKFVTIDGNGEQTNCLLLDGIDYNFFKNFYFKDCTESIGLANVPLSHVFDHCVYTDQQKLFDGDCDDFLFYDCYLADFNTVSYASNCEGTGVRYIGCIVNRDDNGYGLTTGLANVDDICGLHLNNIVIGCSYPFLLRNGDTVFGNIIYNSTHGFRGGGGADGHMVAVFNNIVLGIDADSKGLWASSTSGWYYGYNCYWSIAGVALSNPYTHFVGPVGSFIDGEGKIEADPCFVSPANGDFRLRSKSPVIQDGWPILGRSTTMGAIPTRQYVPIHKHKSKGVY